MTQDIKEGSKTLLEAYVELSDRLDQLEKRLEKQESSERQAVINELKKAIKILQPIRHYSIELNESFNYVHAEMMRLIELEKNCKNKGVFIPPSL